MQALGFFWSKFLTLADCHLRCVTCGWSRTEAEGQSSGFQTSSKGLLLGSRRCVLVRAGTHAQPFVWLWSEATARKTSVGDGGTAEPQVGLSSAVRACGDPGGASRWDHEARHLGGRSRLAPRWKGSRG